MLLLLLLLLARLRSSRHVTDAAGRFGHLLDPSPTDGHARRTASLGAVGSSLVRIESHGGLCMHAAVPSGVP